MKTKKKLLTVLALVLLLPAFAQQKTNNDQRTESKIGTENRTVTPFDKIDISGRFLIKLHHSAQPEIAVITAEEYIPSVSTQVENGVLKITITNPKGDNNIIEGLKAKLNDYLIRQPIEIHIGVADLKEINAGGVNTIEADAVLNVNNLYINLADASKANIKVNVANSLVVSLSGASKMEVSGKTETLQISANGASSIVASNLTAKDAAVKLSGASRAEIIATQSLDADLSGATKLVCTGSPKSLKQNASRGSSITVK